MAVIDLETRISAPRERVFDLARSIDLHRASTGASGEEAVAGVTSGLIGRGETVTWCARHLGVRQRLTVLITEFDPPNSFTDEMTKGAFASMRHQHLFRAEVGCTVMVDHFEFRSPFGIIGRVVDALFLTGYLRRFLVERNGVVKRVAESEEWRQFLR